MAGADRYRWAAHPWQARGLRVLVYAVPVAGSLLLLRLAVSVTGAPTRSLWVFLLWWLAMSLAATVVVSLLYSLARRLLPLGALLELSLVFPDEAPSRFRLALRSRTVGELEEQLRRGEAPTAQEAAEMLLALAAALNVHDRITRGHSERVRAYARLLGMQLKLPDEDLDRLNWAALLHDIGKLEVSSEILNKASRPTAEEWESLRLHPLHGEALVEPLRDWLGEWVGAIGYHHERWDGTGYPRGVAGEEIPVSGRIVAIADVFDVITSARSYKTPSSPAEARAEITRCAGTQFDPRLVRAFVDISLGKMRLVVGPLSWLSHAPILARLPLTSSVGTLATGAAAIAAATATGVIDPHAVARAAPPALTHPVVVTRVPAAAAHPSLPRAVTGSAHGRRRTRPPAAGHARSPKRGRSQGHEGTAAVAASRPDAARAEPSGPAATGGSAMGAAPSVGSAPVAGAPTTTAPHEPPPPAATPPKAPSPAQPPAGGGGSTPPPAVNDAPTFSAGGSQSVLEDAGAQTVTGWATAISPGPADEAAQTVTFTVSASNPGLFSVQPAVAPNGTLTYTPAANANGAATITVNAHDNGGTASGGSDTSATRTATITIAPVNDAPDFSAGGSQSVLEDAGAQTVTGWATAISPGPADEAAQTVTFTVSASNPGLFSVQPAVAPNGTLTYTPAANANGAATITVNAHDNGGTASGGSDTSATRTATITIAPVNDAPSFAAGSNRSAVSLLGAQSVPGWATAISPGPSDEAAQTVTFIVSASNPGLFNVQPAVAPNGTLTFTPKALALGSATVTVRAVDSGGSASGGSDTSAPQTFTITIL